MEPWCCIWMCPVVQISSGLAFALGTSWLCFVPGVTMECVIAVQGSYVVINIICDILDKPGSMVGYINSLINSGIVSKPLHFLI